MNRKELVRRVASVMRENNIRKPVSSQKQVFHISDDEGNSKDFIVKKTDKGVLFTYNDVEAVIDTCLAVIGDSLKNGDSVSVRGFGTLGLNYRKPRTSKHPITQEDVVIPGHYVPKFESGKDLKMCAKIYELSLKERIADYITPSDDEEYFKDGDD